MKQDTNQKSINFLFTHQGKEYEVVIDNEGKYLRVIKEYGQVVFESMIDLKENEDE